MLIDFRYILPRLIPWIFSLKRYIRLEKDLNQPDPSIKPKVPVKMRLYHNFPDINEHWGKDAIFKLRGSHGLAKFARRWHHGDVMIGAFVQEELAAFVWIKRKPAPYRKKKIVWAHTYDCWTFDKYRGNNLLPVLQLALSRFCREDWPQITTIDTFVLKGNIPSLNGFLKAGYLPLQEFLSLRFFGKEIFIPLSQ